MTEFYRDAVGKQVTLDVTGASNISLKFIRDDVETLVSPATDSEIIPYSITSMDGDFDVEWTYTVESAVHTRTDRHTIVTPYFTKDQLVFYAPTMEVLGDDNIFKLERLTRALINNATLQSFGHSSGTKSAFGAGDYVLYLPAHLESLTSVAYAEDPTVKFIYKYRIVNSGYGIEMMALDIGDSIKVPAFEERVSGHFTNVQKFAHAVEYLVEGIFGYSAVPSDINLAAMILAEYLSHDESSWNDRYVKAISAADWTLEFDGGAFSGTGNATVDSLLSRYEVNRIAVI